jgi:organic hydroperoxide reductase OsmC/OhrA
LTAIILMVGRERRRAAERFTGRVDGKLFCAAQSQIFAGTVPVAPRTSLAVAPKTRQHGGMSTYTARTEWLRGQQLFTDNRYSRAHRWRFDGGIEVPASSSPAVVPLPLSDANAVDPEEAFVASLSSCHLLWFLSIAAKRGYVVDRYVDDAAGVMARNAEGRLAMTVLTLRPRVTFSGAQIPDRAALEALHHAAHAECFIAASIRSEVRIEPQV